MCGCENGLLVFGRWLLEAYLKQVWAFKVVLCCELPLLKKATWPIEKTYYLELITYSSF